MADSSSNSSWRQQGEGPHPTLAGNILDPGVKADGHMSNGQGVGGTSEGHIREEGLEHIKNNTSGLSGSGGDSTMTGGGYGGASSSYDTTGASSHGTTGAGEQQQGSMISTVKNYLGLGGNNTGMTGSETERPQTGHPEDIGAAPDASPTGAAGGFIGGEDSLGARDLGTRNTTGIDDTLGARDLGSRDTTGRAGEYAAGAGAAGAGAAGAGVAGMERSHNATDFENKHPSATGDPEDMTETSAGRGDQEGAAVSEKKRGHDDDKIAAKRENHEAIPFAGDIRLGEKHWGESKMVPENPKPRDSEAGVSSSSGQPTDEVRDNTSKNTGSAHAHGHDSAGHEKEGMVDKIKDKLHMSHK